MTLGGLSKLGWGLLAGAVVAFTATSGFADGLGDLSLKDTPVAGDKLEWTANFDVTSDYIFRGISQNRRDPTIQGGVDLTYGLFYVGAWSSGVNFDNPFVSGPGAGPHSQAELDLYGGIKPKWGDVTFDFGVIAYVYPGTDVNYPFGVYDPTYVEFKAGASTTILKDVSVGATVFVSPDYSGEVGPSVVVEGTASKSFYKYKDFEFTGSGTIGHIFFDSDRAYTGTPFVTNLDSYTYGNLGVTVTYKTIWSLDLRWWDTDLKVGELPAGPNGSVLQAGSAFAATAKVTF